MVGHRGRITARVDIGGEDAIGDHHAFGLAGRAARVLQDDEPLRIGSRYLQAIAARHAGSTRQYRRHRGDRWITRPRLVERRELVVDQHELGVAVADARPGRGDEALQRTHAHRKREHHGRHSGHPAATHDGDQCSAGRAEDGDMVTGHQAAGLQCRADGPRLVMELAPGDVAGSAIDRHRRADEAHARSGVGRRLQPGRRRGRQRPAHSSRGYLGAVLRRGMRATERRPVHTRQATERQRGSGHPRPAWPRNAVASAGPGNALTEGHAGTAQT